MLLRMSPIINIMSMTYKTSNFPSASFEGFLLHRTLQWKVLHAVLSSSEQKQQDTEISSMFVYFTHLLKTTVATLLMGKKSFQALTWFWRIPNLTYDRLAKWQESLGKEMCVWGASICWHVSKVDNYNVYSGTSNNGPSKEQPTSI